MEYYKIIKREKSKKEKTKNKPYDVNSKDKRKTSEKRERKKD